MNDELEFALNKLTKAFDKLKDGVNTASDELGKDGVIQRFEFTFELIWKTLKIFLQEKGFLLKSPKDCLKEAFRLGWIQNENLFLNMLEDRNKTSHIYDQQTVEEIFLRVKNEYLIGLEKLLNVLKNQL